jgi:hypothetical protein
MNRSKFLIFMSLVLAVAILFWGIDQGRAQSQEAVQSPKSYGSTRLDNYFRMHRMLHVQRKEAAESFKAAREAALAAGATIAPAAMDPGGTPHYFGPYPNYANSPLPSGPITGITVDTGGTGYTAPTVTIEDLYGASITPATATATVDPVTGAITDIVLVDGGSGYVRPVVTITDATGTDATATATIGGPFTGGIRKFVDLLPDLPIAVPDTITYPGSDYYEIELRQYTQKMHSALPPTTLRGYVQTNNGTDTDPLSPTYLQNVVAPAPIQYLGPIIVAQRDRPVRVKFTNNLPTGAAGDLFIPVDTTIMGAGMFTIDDPANPGSTISGNFTQNRATVHLHGNNTVWISDGTPHQWITPAGEITSYPEGVSVYNVPDMPDPGDGSMTLYYTNAQSARLMFYHDHAYGITRLNVYAGEAAGYLLTDQVEKDLIEGTNVSGVNLTPPREGPPRLWDYSGHPGQDLRRCQYDRLSGSHLELGDNARNADNRRSLVSPCLHAEPEPVGHFRNERFRPLALWSLVLASR